jgi:tetratricopeptide (TPR) repeat protein
MFLAQAAFAQPGLRHAEQLYLGTDYRESLAAVPEKEAKSGPALNLVGRDWFMLGDYKKATEAFEKAIALEPRNSIHAHWLGRTYGRRAETSSFFTAPGYASKARQYFELAVELDPKNGEAMNDLFDYYLEAPGMLGGGMDKAEALAQRIAERDPVEGHFAAAQLADRRKQFDTAEDQLRRAMTMAPRDIGRVLDVAKYLVKRGRIAESDAAFDQAERIAPHDPRVAIERARAYIHEKRHLDQARALLIEYLHSNLTPDDPPRAEAEQLLKQAAGS